MFVGLKYINWLILLVFASVFICNYNVYTILYFYYFGCCCYCCCYSTCGFSTSLTLTLIWKINRRFQQVMDYHLFRFHFHFLFFFFSLKHFDPDFGVVTLNSYSYYLNILNSNTSKCDSSFQQFNRSKKKTHTQAHKMMAFHQKYYEQYCVLTSISFLQYQFICDKMQFDSNKASEGEYDFHALS